MATSTQINFRPGAVGRRLAVANVTLASGTGTVNTPFTSVQYVFITEKDASASGETYSWTATGGVITIDSSNGSSTEDVDVLAIGY